MKKNKLYSQRFMTDSGEFFDIIIKKLPLCPAEEPKSHDFKGIFAINNKLKINILNRYFSLNSQIEALMRTLTAALNNDIALNTMPAHGLGYEWNIYLHDTNPDKGRWYGEKYLCFTTVDGPETFIYRREKNIIFEIAPMYPWLFKNTSHHSSTTPFSEFLQTYKPYTQAILSRTTAECWLLYGKKILEYIETQHATGCQSCHTTQRNST